MRPEVSFSFPAVGADESVDGGSATSGVRADPERLTRVLHQHFDSVWRAVRRFGVPSEAADDAAQEVFIIFSRKLDGVRAGGELQYLYGIAMRVAANRRRAGAARREVVDTDAVQAAVSHLPNAETLLEERRLRELLDVALDQLPDELRTALVLFELEGFSEREIAEACAIPLGTVASRLRRARESFHRIAMRLRADLEKSP